MRFEKWHALGNAYLVVDPGDRSLDPDRVRRLCDVATGIGSDGVLEILARDGETAEVLIWNPDGSTAEMSGNGMRIAALWLAGGADHGEVMVTTGGRRVHARVVAAGEAEIDVGEVHVSLPEVVVVGDRELSVITVSVGNPHAVVRLDDPTVTDLLAIGPALERHERFPERTNVQLVDPVGPNELRVLVWERGAGATPASGSSATAAAAAAVAQDWCISPVTVHMPGGNLFVTLAGGRATLLGPAERTCVGETDL